MADEDRKTLLERFREEMDDYDDRLQEIGEDIGNESKESYEHIRNSMSHMSERLDTADDLAGDEWEQFKQDMEDFGGDVRDQINVYIGQKVDTTPDDTKA